MLRLLVLIVWSGVLSGCMAVSGAYTGASLIYDRHNVYIKFNDYQLVAKLRQALYRDRVFKGPDVSLDLAAFNGDVLVAGHVATPALRDELYARIGACDLDYRHIYKQVAVGLPDENMIEDDWITSKIRTQILLDSSLDPHKFKVVTVGAVVYLMGDVQVAQATRVIDIARRTHGVLRVVKLLRYYRLSRP